MARAIRKGSRHSLTKVNNCPRKGLRREKVPFSIFSGGGRRQGHPRHGADRGCLLQVQPLRRWAGDLGAARRRTPRPHRGAAGKGRVPGRCPPADRLRIGRRRATPRSPVKPDGRAVAAPKQAEANNFTDPSLIDFIRIFFRKSLTARISRLLHAHIV